MTKSDPPRCRFVADILLDDPRWEKSEDYYSKLSNKIFSELVKKVDISNIYSYELSIKLTNDHVIQELNLNFRGKNKATNVLSFPSYHLVEGDVGVYEGVEEFYLGDIAISYDRVLEESQNYNIEFENHLIHLLLHSMLHLLGFDHIEEEDAEKMEGLEKEILEKLNIKNPYEIID